MGNQLGNRFENFLSKVWNSFDFQDRVSSVYEAYAAFREFRELELTVKNIKEHSPLDLLSALVISWPLSDIRLSHTLKQGAYSEVGSLLFIDDISEEFIRDFVKGMELKERKRSVKDSSLIFDIMVQGNLDKFEAYNKKVTEHNSAWMLRGSCTYDFDPVTGIEERLKDTYVDTLDAESLHHKQIKRNASSGDLTKSAPDVRRVSYGSIEYRILVEGKVFTLGFVAYSKDHEILYYNEVSGYDLSDLVRRSVQEIWGNFKVRDYFNDAYYDGVSYLFKGHKLKICKDRENKLPSWADAYKFKAPTKEGALTRGMYPQEVLFRVFLPIVIFLVGVVIIPFSVVYSGDDSFLISKIIFSCVLIRISLKTADKIELERKKKDLIDKII